MHDIPLRPTLNVALWLEELNDDPYKAFLSDGISNGFQLVPAGPQFVPAEMENYFSATGPAVRDKVKATLLEEISIGNYVVTDVKSTTTGAIGATPNPGMEETHLIHDWSQPKGSAVNDYADIEHFKYQSIDDAIKLLKTGYFMSKVDLHHAYRSVNIHPSNYAATGLKWHFSNTKSFTYLIDTKLSYGGRHAPGIFHWLTQACRRFMAKRGYKAIVIYLDDFLVIGATYAECMEIFTCLIELLQELGFEIS